MKSKFQMFNKIRQIKKTDSDQEKMSSTFSREPKDEENIKMNKSKSIKGMLI